MKVTHGLGALLAAAVFTASAHAQVQVFGGHGERGATTLIFFSDKPEGGMSIQYARPEWKDEYDTMADQAKGKKLRLGKDWWSTFDTSVAISVGDKKIPAGSYFLGLQCDDDGKFHLALLDSGKAMKHGIMPFMPDTWKVDHTVPLTFHKDASDDTVDELTINLSANDDDPSKGTLELAWGTHKLTANMAMHMGKKSKTVEAGHGKK